MKSNSSAYDCFQVSHSKKNKGNKYVKPILEGIYILEIGHGTFGRIFFLAFKKERSLGLRCKIHLMYVLQNLLIPKLVSG